MTERDELLFQSEAVKVVNALRQGFHYNKTQTSDLLGVVFVLEIKTYSLCLEKRGAAVIWLVPVKIFQEIPSPNHNTEHTRNT